MEKASLALNYEKSNRVKRNVNRYRLTLTKQKIDLKKNYNFDIFNYTVVDNYLEVTVFFIREGVLFGRHHETLQTLGNVVDDIEEYIIKFYEKNILAHEILIPDTLNAELLSEYLNVKVHVPKRGELKKLVDLAEENLK